MRMILLNPGRNKTARGCNERARHDVADDQPQHATSCKATRSLNADNHTSRARRYAHKAISHPKARLSLLLSCSYRTLRFEKLPPLVQRIYNHREKSREGLLNHLLAHHARRHKLQALSLHTPAAYAVPRHRRKD